MTLIHSTKNYPRSSTYVWLKTKRKSSQHCKNPSSHPSIEMSPSNQLSSVSPALYCLSTDCAARIKLWTTISDTVSDPNIPPY